MRSGAMTIRLRSTVIVGALFTTLLVLFGVGQSVLLRPASSLTYFCSGWDGCNAAGYSDAGYGQHSSTSYWRMYAGHNCVNYVAYRMVKSGMPNTRPWTGSGNAANWGHALASKVDQSPAVGAVAWWDAYHHVGSAGHVAYVEKVNSPDDIIISEDSWSGTFHWQHLTKDGGFWPSGFIHINDGPTAPAITNTARPSIVGTAQVGQTLAAKVGAWTGGPTRYTYGWYANGVAIPGATSSTFTPTPAQVTKKIGVRVTAYAPKGAAKMVPARVTHMVAPGTFMNTAPASFDGDTIVGQTLTAHTGEWSPAPSSYTYAWTADGQPIDGATTNTLKLTPALVGKNIAVTTHPQAAGYATGSSTSPAEQAYAGRIAVVHPYAISGRARPGSVLTVRGDFTPKSATPHYQWMRSGRPIAGATGSTYRLTAADIGYKLSVAVDLEQPGWVGTKATASDPDTVRVAAHVHLSSVGRTGSAVINVSVAATGVSPVDGTLVVRVGGVRQRVLLHDGAAQVVFSHLHAGHYAVRAYYLRNRYTLEAHRFGGVAVS
ncbi:CHAP domain-containing protein [Nocardioides montaniterrae]